MPRPVAGCPTSSWANFCAWEVGWTGLCMPTTVAESLTKGGFTIRAQIIWAKERLVMGRGDYHWQHEPCWYAVRSKGHWTGDRKQTTLWSIATGGQDSETEHATQKPVECMRRPMLKHKKPRRRQARLSCKARTPLNPDQRPA
jgi:DNA modification methylase